MASILFVSPGNDGPSIQIFVDANGKIHIVRVPGWNPEIMQEITSAVKVISLASQIENQRISEQFLKLGESVIQSRSREIQEYVNQAM